MIFASSKFEERMVPDSCGVTLGIHDLPWLVSHGFCDVRVCSIDRTQGLQWCYSAFLSYHDVDYDILLAL